jgi:BirA family biotin operon repressor/biotin-[acetyl-CoA-carboxylase] ligase
VNRSCSQPGFDAALAAGFAPLVHVALVDSTNTALMERPFGPTPAPPRVLWADRQCAGRGRRGRRWIDAPGQCLMFSVAFERQVAPGRLPPPAFSLVAGLCLHQVLAVRLERPARLRLKWPNDLLLDQRKLSGILVETRREGRIERLVVGIGLNLRAPPQHDIAARSAGWLAPGQAWQQRDSECLMADVSVALRDGLARVDAHGFAAFQAQWVDCDAWLNREVSLAGDNGLIATGLCLGVDETGALCLHTADGLSCHAIGELSLRAVLPDAEAA